MDTQVISGKSPAIVDNHPNDIVIHYVILGEAD